MCVRGKMSEQSSHIPHPYDLGVKLKPEDASEVRHDPIVVPGHKNELFPSCAVRCCFQQDLRAVGIEGSRLRTVCYCENLFPEEIAKVSAPRNDFLQLEAEDRNDTCNVFEDPNNFCVTLFREGGWRKHDDIESGLR